MRRLASAFLGLIFATSLAAQGPSPSAPAPTTHAGTLVALDYDSLAFATQLTEWLRVGNADSLWAHTDPAMQLQMAQASRWTEISSMLSDHTGPEASVVSERFVISNGKRQYQRTFNATLYTEEPLVIHFVLLPGRMIGGVGISPQSHAPPIDP